MNKRFAEMFIDRIRRKTDHKFIVVDREGIIIAATEKERVGVFHEASFIMMHNKLDKFIVNPDEVNNYLGVKPGIDMPIVIGGETLGAFGISGIPEEIDPVIAMAKIAVEVMMEYDILEEKTQKKHNEREQLFSMLLGDSLGKNEQMVSLTKRLGYQLDALRVSIVLIVEGAVPTTLARIMESEDFSCQDLASINEVNEIVIFRRLSERSEYVLVDYREDVKRFLEPIFKEFNRFGIEYKYYIGSIQNNLNNYSFAYKHCCWLRDNQRNNEFFYDHLEDYIKDQIPALELNGIFQTVISLFSDEMMENYMEIVSLLARNNYNLVTSSKELFLHKNTLINRLNKIRDFLNLNPIQNAGDRGFMDYLSFYIGRQHKNLTRVDQGNLKS